MEKFVQEELHELTEEFDRDGKKVRICNVLSSSILNIMWAFTTGTRINRYDRRLNELLELMDKRSKAFDMAGGMLAQFPLMRFVAPEKSGYNLILEFNKAMKQLLMEPIHQHMKSWSEDNKEDDLIYAFITEMKKANGKTTTFTGN